MFARWGLIDFQNIIEGKSFFGLLASVAFAVIGKCSLRLFGRRNQQELGDAA